MKDVFAGLGSGLVKCTDAGVVREGREEKPDFERQQMERSGGMREEKRGRGSSDEDDGFKRPKVALDKGRGRGRGGGGKPRPAPGWKKNPEGYTKYR